MEPGEEELVRRCQEGKEKAFEELYYKFHHSLMQVCIRYARDADEAQDMFQTGFIKVVKNVGKYDASGSFGGWMRRIMVNESINYYHRVSRRGKITYTDDERKMEFLQEAEEPTVHSSLGHADLLDIVKTLPDSYRMVFTLYAIDGFSHKEVAEQLSISVSTSKSNLSRARVLLQNKLKQREQVEDKLRIQNG